MWRFIRSYIIILIVIIATLRGTSSGDTGTRAPNKERIRRAVQPSSPSESQNDVDESGLRCYGRKCHGGRRRRRGRGCNLLRACLNPESCPVLRRDPPVTYDVTFTVTTGGRTGTGKFTVHVTTAWAPPMATRFWHLAKLKYFESGRLFRNAYTDFSGTDLPPWVLQFGIRGDPKVDTCWSTVRRSEETWPVFPPGNVRGSVAFATGAVDPDEGPPYCTDPDYCSQGFEIQVFINYADNLSLNPPDFSPFGFVNEGGMQVAERVYRGYGDVQGICPSDGDWQYCNGYGPDCQGIDADRYLAEGNKYARRQYPLMDKILKVRVRRTDR